MTSTVLHGLSTSLGSSSAHDLIETLFPSFMALTAVCNFTSLSVTTSDLSFSPKLNWKLHENRDGVVQVSGAREFVAWIDKWTNAQIKEYMRE